MNAAIIGKINWRSANTQVLYINGVSYVYLHRNKIAEIGDNFVQLFDGGWQSNTTKSRLNAILRVHGIAGESVFQKNFEWFVNQQGGAIPFFSGMRLNWRITEILKILVFTKVGIFRIFEKSVFYYFRILTN